MVDTGVVSYRHREFEPTCMSSSLKLDPQTMNWRPTGVRQGTSMVDIRRVIPLTISRLLVAPIICGLVACNGSSSNGSSSAPRLVSVTVLVEDSLPRPVADARVEITSGDDAGHFATTAADGHVTISGHTLNGGLSLRISKIGLSSADLWLPSDGGTKRVALIPHVLLDLAGEHRLTLEADPLCDLPELARTRTYEASFAPAPNTPWYINIQLSGAPFFSNLDHFATYVNSDAARYEIYLPGFEEEDPMVEQLSPTEYLAFTGEAIAEANQADTVITARFSGSIEYCAATPTTTKYMCPVPSVICLSESHKLILTRQ